MRLRPTMTREANGLFLNVPLDEMLDAMSQRERRLLLDYGMMNGEWLRVLCAHIAAPDSDRPDPPEHGGDCWLSSDDVRRARLALAPLLGEAVKAELETAAAAIKSSEDARSILRGLVFVRSLWLSERRLDRPDMAQSRLAQFDEAWRAAIAWYNASTLSPSLHKIDEETGIEVKA